MSIGPMGMIGSAAGSSLAQSQSSDVSQTQQESAKQATAAKLGKQAEAAEGVGETEQDQESSDRDADGRRLWEIDQKPESSDPEEGGISEAPPPSKDPTGQRGNRLDLRG